MVWTLGLEGRRPSSSICTEDFETRLQVPRLGLQEERICSGLVLKVKDKEETAQLFNLHQGEQRASILNIELTKHFPKEVQESMDLRPDSLKSRQKQRNEITGLWTNTRSQEKIGINFEELGKVGSWGFGSSELLRLSFAGSKPVTLTMAGAPRDSKRKSNSRPVGPWRSAMGRTLSRGTMCPHEKKRRRTSGTCE